MKRILIACVLFLASLALFGKTFSDHRATKTVLLTGKVINDETRAPIVTQLTVLLKDFTTIEIVTNTNGEFSTTIPESDQCKILIRAAGFESQDDVVPLAPNANHYVEIHLIPYIKVILDGELLTDKDNKPIKGELRVFHNSDFEMQDDKVISSGKYSEPLTDYGYYIIDLSAPGYLNKVDTLWVLSCSRKTIHKSYQLTRIVEGLTIQLKNIHFDFAKITLSPDSYAELDRIAELFKNNPSIKAEFAGHTDNDGPPDYNFVLSQLRAQEVVCYLEGKGVSEGQIVAVGYGATKPIDSNLTHAGKANNRRVEMVILKD